MNAKDFLKEWRDKESFVKCNTSGSTGKPKTILLPKGKMMESAWRTINFFGLTSQSRLHLCISPDFIGGKMMIARADLLGCKLTVEEPSNRPLSGNLDSQPISLLAVVPSQIPFILGEKENLPPLEAILSGGGPLNDKLRHEICESGLNVFESYGMTETSSHIALRKVTEDKELPFETLGDISVSLSEDNCLVIHIPGWQTVVTNDIADVIDSRHFRIIGRKDNVIISGGKKFFPEDVERKLSPFIPLPFAISSLQDEKWGERIVCVVETDKTDSFNPAEIIEIAGKSLPHDILPKEFLTLTFLPLTDSGKIDRRNLSRKIKE